MAATSSASAAAPGRQASPYDSIGWWSRCTYSFVTPLLRAGAAKEFNDEDLWALADNDHAPAVTDRLQREWEADQARCGGVAPEAHLNANKMAPSLWRAMYYAEKGPFWWAAWYCFLESACRIGQPLLLGALLDWLTVADPADRQLEVGLLWAAALAAVAFAQAVVHHRLYFFTMRGGFNVRTGLVGLVHRKLLRLHGASLSSTGSKTWTASDGKIVNIVSNDAQRFDWFMPRMHFGWSGPMDFFVVAALMVLRVGWVPTIAGVAIILLSVPLTLWFGKRMSAIRRRTAALTDQRVQLTAETFSGILAVKAACWEPAFASAVADMRARERDMIFRAALMKSVNNALGFATPYVATLCTFLAFWLQGETLNISVVFSTMSLIHVMRLSIGKNLTMFVESLPEVLVAVRRIHRFLALPEKHLAAARGEGSAAAGAGDDKGACVALSNASFAWGLPDAVKKQGAAGDAAGADGDTRTAGAGQTEAVLHGVTVTVNSGQLLMVVGPTGSGKSALLGGILGEVERIGGSVNVRGRVATVEQEAWIMAGSVRSNIVWGDPHVDEARYARTIEACALTTDLEQLPDGDATAIGERGVNLSGGQKSRVSLARSLYADADVYLVDDCLSAVDPAVGTHLMEKVLLPLRTAGKAVVLVTHHIKFAQQADIVLRLNLDGSVAAVGPPADVDLTDIVSESEESDGDAARDGDGDDDGGADGVEATAGATDADSAAAPANGAANGDGAAVGPSDVTVRTAANEGGAAATGAPLERTERVRSHSSSHARPRGRSRARTTSTDGSTDATPQRLELVKAEERTMGHVRLHTYVRYLQSAGTATSIFIGVLFIAGQVCALLADVSLKVWADLPAADQADSSHFNTFLAFTVAATASGFLRGILFFFVGLRAATRLHDAAFRAVVRSPMSFFISNPLGRILNKFSSDLAQVDEQLPVLMYDVLQALLLCVGSLVLAVLAIPWVLIAAVPLMWVLVKVRAYFLTSSRALKRLESISKSPVFTSFSANMAGRATIRAYAAEERVRVAFEECLEETGRAWMAWLLVNRWVGYRLDMITFALFVAVVVGGAVLGSMDLVDHGLLAIAITYCIQLSGVFQYMVRVSARVETSMTSVERLEHYTLLEPEAEPDEADMAPEGASFVRMDADGGRGGGGVGGGGAPQWPTEGAITLENLRVRYRSDLPTVLKGVDLAIPGGCKIGVVGRTGSGKSSLMLAMCRLNEVCGGRCLIDGVDVSRVPLHALRSIIGVIPQLPTLFVGTLRRNVDPTGRFSDAEVWDALKAVGMERFGSAAADTDDAKGGPVSEGSVAVAPSALERGLAFPVEEHGRNLSVGERQCVSMARALLLRARIYIADEATANIDMATDAMLQKMMRTHPVFAKATVLVVAHRIATIMSSDVVAVLNNGRVVEVGAPAELVARAGSVFGSMVAAGERALE